MKRLYNITGTILFIIIVLVKIEDIFFKEEEYKEPPATSQTIHYPDTIYVIHKGIPKEHQQVQEEPVEWIFPPGNQRLNIPPGSGLEREWQNQKRKTYKPDYELIPVETNY